MGGGGRRERERENDKPRQKREEYREMAEKLIRKEKDKNNWEIGRENERYIMRLRG